MDIFFLLLLMLFKSSLSSRNFWTHLHNDGDLLKHTSFLDKIREQAEKDDVASFRDLNPEEIDSEYDFIVIGSGSAGSVIANRLSEIPEWKILLLEVGRQATSFANIPMIAPALQYTDLNWGYLMEKQEGMSLGLVDQRMAWPRGRALGGTTVINYMLGVRGNKDDYNNWEKMGNPGWSYRDVVKYFIKSENAFVAVNDSRYRGTEGYLSVQDVPYRTESVHAWVRACQESGYKYVDYNGKEQIGVSYVQGTIKKGSRCSVERAFLRPVKDRPNLTILTGARATKILINHKTRQAYGVRYKKGFSYHVALARKEVISSAGAFNSPQLLMLSGIGPKQQLEEIGIKSIVNLPVGQKMYDHLTFMGLLFTVNKTITTKAGDLISPLSFINYLRGHGPYTGLGGVEAFTYLKTRNEGPKSLPDMELLFIGLGLQIDGGLLIRKTFRISDEQFKGYWGPVVGKSAFQVFPMLLHPKSYGYLELKSNVSCDVPLFHGNYFTDPEKADIKSFITAIREIQRIVRTSPSLQKYNATLVPWSIPGCQKEVHDSDSYWECGLRHLSVTLHHQVTTCKMGPSTDPEAVVDHRLRVYGVGRLRVADTSIFPTPIAAHVNLPAVMTGEKLSDMVKEDWGLLTGSTV